MILILGGTIESRQTADRLREAGYSVVLSTATNYGGKFVEGGAPVRSGPLTAAQLVNFIEENAVRAIVDATHPFAQQITEIARGICDQQGLPYMRLERGQSTIRREDVTVVSSITTAIGAIEHTWKRIFLATGVKSIGKFVAGAQHAGGNPEFFARILPTVNSVEEASRWLPPSHIVAAIGPFNHEFNRWCWRRFNVDTVITKDSGAGAGVEAKVETALELGLRVILVERPAMDPRGFADPRLLVEKLVDIVEPACERVPHEMSE